MDAVILDNIEAEINAEKLARKLRIKRGSAISWESFKSLVNEAVQIARPKALYKMAYVDAAREEAVVLDGIELRSLVLAVNLAEVQRVFPFVATCGSELARWAMSKDDVVERFWAEAIMDRALFSAVHFLEEHIKQRYLVGKTAMLSPGSLDDWPVEEQSPLFSLLGDTEEHIGVRLTDSLMMDPVQSLSGILFPVEVDFAACQLCPRENCPKRRAPYDRELYDKRFRLHKS
ncbi:MAG: vitamin B12 dependent methionine synthase [Deltaproteobacteria bacterium]|nr:vitamin B12 dependent methionine synthase [Deltaproteobacteria bacterium]MBW2070042.1 vitamin B12 dependent methionine synthase [Deltaproteobacteria bacterium]